MQKLTEQINDLLEKAGLKREAILGDDVKPVYPFSETGQFLAYMISKGILSYEDYLRMSDDYRNRNKYLDLFEMSPRTFGETWVENHIRGFSTEFAKATKENCGQNFSGEYDLKLEDTRIEVKACRACREDEGKNLSERALSRQEAREHNFNYHFQQLKPSCCDVFVWIGVCKDELIYWILSSEEVSELDKFTSQHRNEIAVADKSKIYEGQVFMTDEELKRFEVSESDLLNAVKSKAEKQR